jgi:transcription-repair coupling factor (superfamily II helicase)
MLPASLKRLFRVTSLRLRAEKFGISRIDANSKSGRLEFGPNTAVDPLSLVELIQQQPGRYKLGSANQLMFNHECQEADDKLAFINELLDHIRLSERQAA